MNPFTVIYTESWMVGSHRQTVTKMKHVEAKTASDVSKSFDGAAIFIFSGYLESL